MKNIEYVPSFSMGKDSSLKADIVMSCLQIQRELRLKLTWIVMLHILVGKRR